MDFGLCFFSREDGFPYFYFLFFINFYFATNRFVSTVSLCKIKSKNRERSKKITKKKKSKRLCGFVGLGREKRGKNEELAGGSEGGRKNKWEIENENVFKRGIEGK